MSGAATKEKDQRRQIVATAERLFREIGFQKTTVADIARELRMSPANVYRFFGSKAEINEAVARQLMCEVETEVEKIAAASGSASDRLRALIKTNEAMNAERFIGERKLHDMVEVALNEQWPIVEEHIERIVSCSGRIIAEGMRTGEFAPGDPELATRLVHTACVRFCHPRLMVECADDPVPSIDQMVDFCLAALKAKS
ncbi:TetR/AcrR family transcriptional regulator [Rhodoblastus sp. 17X3]|uniref:TetR/AcrR family transcriptional regulator n=1 Tax=Rhodoblastus sp. 17X3 TaxID=3047026 RepID=UPI0024B641A5|nr:TetR/AcrR family transcriptional regulator [Rhodoblastus sp. 17X3]MDI9847839.1 TetR/AcrR family transcriptional regulator [Rhodoblastus sp. 17X3]